MNQDEESDTTLADFIGFEEDLYDVIDTLPNSCQRRRSIMTTAMMMIMTTMVPRPMYTGVPLCRIARHPLVSQKPSAPAGAVHPVHVTEAAHDPSADGSCAKGLQPTCNDVNTCLQPPDEHLLGTELSTTLSDTVGLTPTRRFS
ncbi:hypothetical protein [Streptomyces sp. NPDC047070]|uniref:hypothetical protein n=1 Tax=Streptomyces sp. NPDC047070 TaxID=3154923 RepID=UPI003451FCC6